MSPSPSFIDNFSKQAAIYARYRPHYPAELFDFLASLTPAHELVWDAGTGNGQAAAALAERYEAVVATDPSAEQIRHATQHERVEYRVEPAETPSLESGVADIVTVANAMHWFKLDEFYKEVRRVLKPGGIVAAWAYAVPTIAPEVDKIIRHLHDVTLDSFWVHENRLVEQEYRTIPFPFEEISAPSFVSTRQFTLDDIVAYLDTWSATQKYMATHGVSPTAPLGNELACVWGDGNEEKTVTWKLVLKVGRV